MLEDADLAGAASAASVGRFFNCGQACLAVKRVFVHEKVADEFTERLVAKAQKLTIGPGTMDGVFLGPLHSERQRAEIEEQVEDARASGEVLTGGGRPDIESGYFYEPTIIREPARDSRSRARRSSGRCCRSGG